VEKEELMSAVWPETIFPEVRAQQTLGTRRLGARSLGEALHFRRVFGTAFAI